MKGEIRDTKLKERQLVNKSAVAGFIDKADLNKTLVTLAIKAEVKNKLENIIKLQAFDSSYFHGINDLEDDGTQNYLVFQSVYAYFKNC